MAGGGRGEVNSKSRSGGRLQGRVRLPMIEQRGRPGLIRRLAARRGGLSLVDVSVALPLATLHALRRRAAGLEGQMTTKNCKAAAQPRARDAEWAGCEAEGATPQAHGGAVAFGR
jgi:hypothetical protein